MNNIFNLIISKSDKIPQNLYEIVDKLESVIFKQISQSTVAV